MQKMPVDSVPTLTPRYDMRALCRNVRTIVHLHDNFPYFEEQTVVLATSRVLDAPEPA